MRAPNVVGGTQGRRSGLPRKNEETADGGGLGTYNSRSGRPRQGCQATRAQQEHLWRRFWQPQAQTSVCTSAERGQS